MVRLSSWLFLVRCFQLLGALPIAVINGYLAVRVAKQVGNSGRFLALELLVVAIVIHAIVCMSAQQTGNRKKKVVWQGTFVALDFVFCSLAVGIIILLAQAGLPQHCGGLTGPSYSSVGRRRRSRHQPIYSTDGFSYPGDLRGRLDKFCGAERYYLCIAIIFVFSYMLTTLLTLALIMALRYGRKSELVQAADDCKRGDASDKTVSDCSPLLSTPQRTLAVPAPPFSESVMTRHTSVRSVQTMASSHSGMSSHRAIASSTASSAAPPMPAFASEHCDLDMEAAHVADGLQAQRHAPYRMPRLREEATGDMALVSDGMARDATLPPYEPRAVAMSGHGLESNEVRLSGYVKGETRAQDSKDSGRV